MYLIRLSRYTLFQHLTLTLIPLNHVFNTRHLGDFVRISMDIQDFGLKRKREDFCDLDNHFGTVFSVIINLFA
jgi:hypothetical protein